MATYNTYQEAKIANPEFDIYSTMISNGGSSEVFGVIGFIEKITSNFKECNPADYCMTVEEFLVDGHKFVDGDVFLNHDGDIVEVGKWYQSIRICPEEANLTVDGDENCYILRAAALEVKPETPPLQTGEGFEHSKTLNFIRDRLVEVHGEPKNLDYMHKLNNAIAFVEQMEGPSNLCGSGTGKEEKPKRTKVSYEKMSFECAWRAIKAFEDGEKLYTKLSSEEFALIDNAPDVLRYLYDLHERVEIEITEREEFTDELASIQKVLGDCHLSDFYDALYDSGKFKLVN